MRFTIEGPPDKDDPPRPVSQRLVWFVVLWCAGLGATAIVAYLLRAALFL